MNGIIVDDEQIYDFCADVLVEKIRCLEIDGISIEDIYDKSLGDLNVLDIL